MVQQKVQEKVDQKNTKKIWIRTETLKGITIFFTSLSFLNMMDSIPSSITVLLTKPQGIIALASSFSDTKNLS
jgi:hypothetical protein